MSCWCWLWVHGLPSVMCEWLLSLAYLAAPILSRSDLNLVGRLRRRTGPPVAKCGVDRAISADRCSWHFQTVNIWKPSDEEHSPVKAVEFIKTHHLSGQC